MFYFVQSFSFPLQDFCPCVFLEKLAQADVLTSVDTCMQLGATPSLTVAPVKIFKQSSSGIATTPQWSWMDFTASLQGPNVFLPI